MPQSTQLPAPVLEWESEYYLPGSFQAPISYAAAGAGGFFDRLSRRRAASISSLPSTLVGAHTLANYTFVGVGAANWLFVSGPGGRRCLQTDVSVNPGDRFVADWRPPDWLPHVGDESLCAPGSFTIPGSVVGVFDWNLAAVIGGGAPSWPDDVTGVFFQANEASGDTVPGVAATADTEGFGVFCNDDGAGGARWEYVSWAAGSPGAILERVPIVANVAEWSTIRFVLITGASGRQFSIEVYANGVEVAARSSGSAELAFLNTTIANTTGPTNRIMVGQGPDALQYQMSARFGRFTPDGVELQGQ